MKAVVRRLLVLTALLTVALASSAQARVMNGSDAGPGEYPWTVALLDPARGAPFLSQFCGGSLIAPDMVLTAAHCAMGSRAAEIDVFAGDRDLTDEDPGERYDVVSIHLPATAVVDPDSDAAPRRDMAVLRLDEPVTGVDPIAPVAPAPAAQTDWADGDDLEVMGWGLWHNEEPSPYPDVLQHATIDRVSDADCETAWGPEFFPEDMVCALRPGPPVVDSCGGDSGGPLTTHPAGADPTDSADFRLAGVVSFGSADCDVPDAPGVYARVAAADLHAFVEDFRDGFDDEGADADPAAQIEGAGGSPVLGGTLQVGQQITCDPGTTTWTATPDTLERRLRFHDAETADYVTVAVGSAYTLQASDRTRRFVCEVHARKAGVGGYGVGRSGLSAPVAAAPVTDDPAPPVTPVTPPTTPPTVPTTPAPPDPQPFVPEPLRDEVGPRTTRITKRCVARRCVLTIRAVDGGALVSGVQAVDLTLTTRYRCTRRGRARTCSRRSNLVAKRVAPGIFRTRTARLPRRSRNTLRVWAIDAAGNEEARPRLYGFLV